MRRKKKKNRYIFPCQLRADQMPGPPQEGQLTYELTQILCRSQGYLFDPSAKQSTLMFLFI